MVPCNVCLRVTALTHTSEFSDSAVGSARFDVYLALHAAVCAGVLATKLGLQHAPTGGLSCRARKQQHHDRRLNQWQPLRQLLPFHSWRRISDVASALRSHVVSGRARSRYRCICGEPQHNVDD